MEGISGSTAVVTGAGQGNGKAIAIGLARLGAHVCVWDINGKLAGETASLIAWEGGKSMHFEIDVSDFASCGKASDASQARFGDATILVNNAGIIRRQLLDDAEFDTGWDALFRVNVAGMRNVTRALLPQLRRTQGRIVNLASIMSVSTGAGLSAYAASKGAVLQLTKAFAHELAKDGIRVNAIAPGVIATSMTESTRADPAALGRFMAHTPMGRVGEPEELVGPVAFLTSTLSSYVTGVLLPVDGGYLVA